MGARRYRIGIELSALPNQICNGNLSVKLKNNLWTILYYLILNYMRTQSFLKNTVDDVVTRNETMAK